MMRTYSRLCEAIGDHHLCTRAITWRLCTGVCSSTQHGVSRPWTWKGTSDLGDVFAVGDAPYNGWARVPGRRPITAPQVGETMIDHQNGHTDRLQEPRRCGDLCGD